VTTTIEIEPGRVDPRRVDRVVTILHEGGVAAYPTDTMYALGCAIEARKGVERIFRTKQMDQRQRLALICPDVSTAAVYGHLSHEEFRLAKQIFPGPYTLVLTATREIPRTLLDKKRREVGIRIPDHSVTIAIVKALGRPLLTTSAFPTLDETLERYRSCVDVAVDSGDTAGDVSTVLRLTDEGIEILRQGAGRIDQL